MVVHMVDIWWTYGGANFVPIEVPLIWLNISSDKIKLFFNTNSAASKINNLLNLIGIRFLYFVMQHTNAECWYISLLYYALEMFKSLHLIFSVISLTF